ncbi:MAG: hypothetical protein JNM95_04300 [Chitinophagaceae bacterium]|nr:hypothetical protein [Chitinophagaceae bacterium]
MKKILVLCLAVLTIGIAKAQDRTYGPFYGIHVFGYKSNLFNSDDFRADSFQKYQFTPGFGATLEFGRLYQSGFSVAGGLSFGTSNQKYVGNDISYTYNMTATTSTSFLKIPIIFGLQAHKDKRLKYFYTLGFYYSYNTGYKDVRKKDYKDDLTKAPTETTTITKDTYTITYDTTKLQTVLSMDKSPIVRNGFGALAGFGINYRIKDKMQFIAQLKGEFTITNIESIEKTRFRYVDGTNNTVGFPYSGYVYDNYTKYMNDPKSNWNRSGTHPFNLGIQIGIRYYLYDFNEER